MTAAAPPSRDRRSGARVAAQGLAAPLPGGPAGVATQLGAVQAQDLEASRWALGLRCGGTRREVEQAAADRHIVRTWPMRGTLHWVPAADAAWMCALLAAPALRSARSRLAQLGLTPPVLDTARGVIEAALAGGGQASRPALFALLAEHGIDPTGQRGIHVLGRLAQQGVLCHAVPQGRQPTFALLAEWVPRPASPAREEAMATLAHRYVSGHGPVTARDFAWWSGQTLAFARESLELVRDRCRVEKPGAEELFCPPDPGGADGGERDGAPPRRPLLLPAFDELILGYRDRSPTMDPATSALIAPGANGLFRPAILVSGRVVGAWSRATRRGAVALTLTLFRPLPREATAGLARAAASYGAFLGLPVTVTFVTSPQAAPRQ